MARGARIFISGPTFYGQIRSNFRVGGVIPIISAAYAPSGFLIGSAEYAPYGARLPFGVAYAAATASASPAHIPGASGRRPSYPGGFYGSGFHYGHLPIRIRPAGPRDVTPPRCPISPHTFPLAQTAAHINTAQEDGELAHRQHRMLVCVPLQGSSPVTGTRKS